MENSLTIRMVNSPVQANDLLTAFGEFLRLDVAQGDASPETIRTYHAQVNQFVDWCAERGITPAAASESELKAYRAHLAETYDSRATVSTKLAAVRRFYAMAQARGFRADNPAEGLRAPKDTTDRADRVKFLSVAETVKVLGLLDPSTPTGKRDRAIITLFVYNGPRLFEVAALDIGDLDLERGEIVIRHGKGGKQRTLLIGATVTDAVREWLDVWESVTADAEPALFVSLNHDPAERGRRMTSRAIRALVDGYLERAGCKRPGVSCHSLRHTFATLALAGGAKLTAISDALGHSNITTTQVYAKIVDRRVENPSRFVAEILGGTMG